MNLDEMQEIAGKRTPGNWSLKAAATPQDAIGVTFGDAKQASKDDAAFVAMAANSWDKVMEVVGAAGRLASVFSDHTSAPLGANEAHHLKMLKLALRKLDPD